MNKKITTGLVLFSLLFSTFLIVKAAESLPDLVANDVQVGDDNGVVYAKFIISNNGMATKDGQVFSIKAVDLDTGDIYTAGYAKVLAGQSEVWSAQPLKTKKIGYYKLKVTIDDFNTITESNETNNILEKTLSFDTPGMQPDLVANDVQVGDDSGVLYAKFIISNNGMATKDGQVFSIKAIDLDTGDIYTAGYAKVLAGQSEVWSAQPLKTKKIGYYKLKVTIDDFNTITESNETNNILEKTLSFDTPENIDPKKSVIDTQLTDINNSAKSLKDGKISELLSQIKQLRDELREQATELKYLKAFASEMRVLNINMQSAIKTFITYGVDDNTKKLGAGERAAVINSYEAAFDKLPTNQAELADAIKIANGRFPAATSTSAEQKAKDLFNKIYNRTPDMNNVNDVAAIKVMAYGLRQKAQNRNMNSEKAGITTFKHIFGSTPKTTEDWNTMQAITYSGAKK